MTLRIYGAAVAALLIGTATVHAATYSVSQSGKKFDKKEITIAVGDSVVFMNDDQVSHNVYSRTKGRKFDLKVQHPGASNSVTFDNPGVVKVRCAIHPKMKLTVNVTR